MLNFCAVPHSELQIKVLESKADKFIPYIQAHVEDYGVEVLRNVG